MWPRGEACQPRRTAGGARIAPDRGVALFLVLGRQGIVGSWLDETFGITIPFTTTAVVIAETFVAMPFLVISVEGALRGADARYEEAAATLGASRWTAFRRVTLPLIGPGVAAGAVLCWARALGEFGATITFAGNFPGTTQTMPIAVYLALQQDPDAAIVLSETAGAYEFSTSAVALLTAEWTELVRRYRSHPSVVVWVPVNESWGVQRIAQDPAQQHFDGTVELTVATLVPFAGRAFDFDIDREPHRDRDEFRAGAGVQSALVYHGQCPPQFAQEAAPLRAFLLFAGGAS